MTENGIPPTFLSKAAALLADTNAGLSGPKIVEAMIGYAERWQVQIPYPSYPYDAPNKRTALLDNLKVFSQPQQLIIIEELCDHYSFLAASRPRSERAKLRTELFTRFAELRPNNELNELDASLIEATRHWLNNYPSALKFFEQAKLKYDAKIFQRNLIDDLCLALELLLKAVFDNSNSLENQTNLIGSRLKDRGATPQFRNMFQKLLDYYGKYQNEFVKHADKLPEEEIEFIIEITASFMKHIVKVAH